MTRSRRGTPGRLPNTPLGARRRNMHVLLGAERRLKLAQFKRKLQLRNEEEQQQKRRRYGL